MDGFIIPLQIGGEVYAKPANEKTRDYFAGRFGEMLAVYVTEDRDLVEHNRFFAILRACVHNLPQYNVTDKKAERLAVDDLRIGLAYETGFTTTRKDLQGRERVIPRSLSFKDTSEEDFRDYRERSYAVLCRMLGCTLDELITIGLQ